jgi:hypothetical protein
MYRIMKLERWTLFIDMLGYGNINGTIKTEEQAAEFIAFMKSNVAFFEVQDSEKMKEMYAGEVFDLYKYYEVKVLFVSDSLMISYTPKEVDEEIKEQFRMLHSANALFVILQRLQIYIYNCMNEKKILVRGGISNKFALIDSQFAVGEGIIEGYELESKKAIYPRIILSDDIITNDGLMKCVNLISKAMYRIESIIEYDEQGVSYLDYIGYNIRRAIQGGRNLQNLATYNAFFLTHKETIEHHIEITSKATEKIKSNDPCDYKALADQEKVLAKYIWLKNYHNRKIKTLNHEELEKRFLIPE